MPQPLATTNFIDAENLSSKESPTLSHNDEVHLVNPDALRHLTQLVADISQDRQDLLGLCSQARDQAAALSYGDEAASEK